MSIDFNLLSQKTPFMSVVRYGQDEYVGIIQNSSTSIVSLYSYDLIPDKSSKSKFLKLGQEWWWYSNRTIPIDIFLKGEFDIFKKYLLSFNSKETEIIHGPVISLGNIAKKRIKRRRITLVKNPNKHNQ